MTRRWACILTAVAFAALVCAVLPARAAHPDDIYWTAQLGDTDGGRVRGLFVTHGDLYVGGNFTSMDGLDIAGLARWDGSNWHQVGDNSRAAHVILALGPHVYAATSGLTYYTGPQFSRWDGSAWLTFPAENIGLNNDAGIADIVEFKGEIYVGGSFRVIGGLRTFGIARWDGDEWHDLAGGLEYRTGWYSEYDDGKVYSMAADDDYLYVGGNFTHAGGVAASRMARWDGAQWSAFPDYSVGSTGEVAVAGGKFYTSGWTSVRLSDGVGHGIYMWDGTRWSSMNGGVNDYVVNMTTAGGDLYVIGAFTMAGDVPARNVARWDGGAWTALGSGVKMGIGWGGSTGIWGPSIAARENGEVFAGGVAVGDSPNYGNVARFYNPCPYPARPAPANPARRVPRAVALSWEDGGAPGPATHWDLYFGTAADPPLVAAGLTARSYQPDTLAYQTTYYWRVVARDAAGNHATGSTWKFTTEPLITARLIVSPVSAYCGGEGPDTVTVDVSVEKTPTVIDAAGFDLPFDTATFTFLGCEPAALTADWDHFGCADRGGYVRVGGYDLDGIPAASSGVIARLRFAVDCCAFDSTASFALCPTGLTDDLKPLAPFCAAATCTSYVHDGDVDGDSRVTSSDAVCAVESYVEGRSPCGSEGWDVRGDVDCNGAVTPRDALCIQRNWAGGSCAFCGSTAAPALAPAAAPQLSVADAAVEDGVLSLVIAVSGVAALEAFGFDVVYPEAHAGYLGHSRTPLTEPFEWVAGRTLAADRARIGGFGTHAGEAALAADLVVLRVRIRDRLAGVLTLTDFVDDLAGAPDLVVDLETVTGATPSANAFTLAQNRPNPFNPLTTIRYELPASFGTARVRLAIYDVAGRRVRTLVDRAQGGGAYDALWDGRDDRGGRVTSGVYFYVLDAGGKRLARKLVLLK